MEKAKLSTTRKALWLAIFLFTFTTIFAQEIPNGDGDLLWKIKVAEGKGVDASAIHPINSNILIAKYNKIYEYDIENGNLIRTIQPDSTDYNITNMIITHNGEFIVVSLYAYDIDTSKFKYQVISYESGMNLDTLEPHLSLNFFPNNKFEVLGRNSKEIFKYSYNEKKIISSVPNEYVGGIEKLCISPDGSLFAVAYKYADYYYVDIYDANTFQKIKQLPYKWEDPVFILKFSYKNTYLSVMTPFVTECTSINLGTNNKTSYEGIYSIDLSLDEKIMIASGGWDHPGIDFYSTETKNKKFKINNWGSFDFVENQKILITRGDSLFLYSNNWYTVGVDEPKISQSTISPNPASDYIKVGDAHVRPLQEIRIFDVFGNCILNVETIHELSQRIDISALPPGVYFLRIGDEKPMKFMVVR